MIHTSLSRKHGGLLMPGTLREQVPIIPGTRIFISWESGKITFSLKEGAFLNMICAPALYHNTIPISPDIYKFANFTPGAPLKFQLVGDSVWSVVKVSPDDTALNIIGPDGYQIPPEWLIQCFSSTPDIDLYLTSGLAALEYITSLIIARDVGFFGKQVSINILDFGCGAGRVFRHFDLTALKVYGCDLHKQAIEFNKIAFPLAEFEFGFDAPPTTYHSGQFDLVYGISVISHLDIDQIGTWLSEWSRIIKPDGYLFLTFNGDDFVDNFLDKHSDYYHAISSLLAKQGYAFINDNGWEGVFPDFYQTMYIDRALLSALCGKYFRNSWLTASGKFNNRQNCILLQK